MHAINFLSQSRQSRLSFHFALQTRGVFVLLRIIFNVARQYERDRHRKGHYRPRVFRDNPEKVRFKPCLLCTSTRACWTSPKHGLEPQLQPSPTDQFRAPPALDLTSENWRFWHQELTILVDTGPIS